MPTELENGAAALEQALPQVHPLAKQISDALLGAVFPLERDRLIWVARENEAPPTLLSILAGLPQRTFTSLDEVQQWIDEG